MMADCPHCNNEITPEVVVCAHCEEYFVRFARVGRPKIYCSDCTPEVRRLALVQTA